MNIFVFLCYSKFAGGECGPARSPRFGKQIPRSGSFGAGGLPGKLAL